MEVESSKEENKLMRGTATDVDGSRKRRRRKKKNICLGLIALVVILVIVFTILGLTVFKAKKPVVNVNSVSLQDMDLSVDIARLRVNLNITINITLTVKNPNSVGFKYSSSDVLLKYRDEVVGQAPLPAGKIGSHATAPMNISLTLMADRILSDPNLISDVRSGTLPFTTYLRLSGKVQILFKIKVKTTTTCDIDIDVFNRRIARQTCDYKTKL